MIWQAYRALALELAAQEAAMRLIVNSTVDLEIGSTWILPANPSVWLAR
ncbi:MULTISPECIES: hypothetical protein [Methylobacterium]|nr:hypothetical protein [Methylobacterium sp. DB0501]NGM34087.1 hypothetical protein [Methylobacterium sp. DB0501]